MHGHEFCAVRESGFDLDVGDHLGHAVHHVGAGQDAAAFTHQLRHGFAVARTFHHGSRYQRQAFRVVELEPTRAAAFGQQRSGEDQQLVFFTRS